jgi:hypothetical protein
MEVGPGMNASRRLALLALMGCAASPPPAAVVDPGAPAAAPVPAPSATAVATPAPPATPPPPMTEGVVNLGDVLGPPTFDAKTTLTAMKPALLHCYNETRVLVPDLHGKLTLRLRLNETGLVTATEAEPGGRANDPGLLGCIGDAMKTATFPKPGGTATITVPLVFRR